jgi:hypothetical protein
MLSERGAVHVTRGEHGLGFVVGVGIGETLTAAVDQCLDQYTQAARMKLNELRAAQERAARDVDRQRTIVEWIQERVSSGDGKVTP